MTRRVAHDVLEFMKVRAASDFYAPVGCGERRHQRSRPPRSRSQNVVDLRHGGLHAFFHAHAEQLLERLE